MPDAAGLGPDPELAPCPPAPPRPGPARAPRAPRALTAAGVPPAGHPAPRHADAAHDPVPVPAPPWLVVTRPSGTGPRVPAPVLCRQTVARRHPSAVGTLRRGAGVVVGAPAAARAAARPKPRPVAAAGLPPHLRLDTRGHAAALRRDGRDGAAGAALAARTGTRAETAPAVSAAAEAPPARTTAGAGLPAAAPAREDRRGGAAEATTARGAHVGTGGPLPHLLTLLHGTDRLMVQALKTDRDLPGTNHRRRARSRYADADAPSKCDVED